MNIFQVEYDVDFTRECPPGRGGFCVPTHYTVTNTEHYTRETAARVRIDALKRRRRADGGTVTGVRMERIHIGSMDVCRQRLRRLFRRDNGQDQDTDDARTHDATPPNPSAGGAPPCGGQTA